MVFGGGRGGRSSISTCGPGGFGCRGFGLRMGMGILESVIDQGVGRRRDCLGCGYLDYHRLYMGLRQGGIWNARGECWARACVGSLSCLSSYEVRLSNLTCLLSSCT